MNFFQFHLGDYARSTSHLTLIEDAVYMRLLRRYYAEEAPLASDKHKLCRWVGATSENEQAAVESVLSEFFELVDGAWHNHRADKEIAAYVEKRQKAADSARKRWQKPRKADAMRTHSKGNANHKPRTNNQEPDTDCAEPTGSPPAANYADQSPVVVELPTNRNSTAGEVYLVTENIAAELKQLYPAVNTEQVLRDVRGWLVANPKKRKTAGGMQRFLFSWFAREQDRGGGGGARASPSTRHSTLKDDLSDTSWAD